MLLSKNFTRAEYTTNFLALELNIENRLPSTAKKVVNNLFTTIIQPLQDSLFEIDKSFTINIIKGYVSPELFKIVDDGSMNSFQHVASNVNGAAVDIIVNGLDPITIMKTIIDEDIIFDKMIWEFPNTHNNGWIHLSYPGENKPFSDQIMIRDKNRPLFILSKDDVFHL